MVITQRETLTKMDIDFSKLELIEWDSNKKWQDLTTNPTGDSFYHFKNKKFSFEVIIKPDAKAYYFESCHFEKGISFEIAYRNNEGETINHYKRYIIFENCKIDRQLTARNTVFDKKFILHNSVVNDISLYNSTFNGLADFWGTKFNNKIIFYKTDFNSTCVFSMVTFEENVLFTYTLFNGKCIFSRAKFNRGIDLSQAIIAGQLKPFDLKFTFNQYKGEYLGSDDETYQKYIDEIGIIPLVNKVHTFQILKKAFEDNGNYADSITMRREEKKAQRNLTKEKLNDNDISTNKGDKYILLLNRLSNNYRSDFRNGIWFVLSVTLFFGLIVLLCTESFYNNLCFSDCEFNPQALGKGVKFFINSLNPTRKLTYLSDLKLYPNFISIVYIADFLGRISVGYGLYQTIQAFRKFK